MATFSEYVLDEMTQEYVTTEEAAILRDARRAYAEACVEVCPNCEKEFDVAAWQSFYPIRRILDQRCDEHR